MSVSGFFKSLPRIIGLDHNREKFSYATDETYGYTAKEKIPDRWVKTTCGYCSVGCGMHIGVKDGRAISARGDDDHPVNYGKLCPKGLSEHDSIHAEGRALYPLLKERQAGPSRVMSSGSSGSSGPSGKASAGEFRRVTWDHALYMLVEKFRWIQARYGNESIGVVSTGQLVTEEFYTLGKLIQLGFKTKNYDGNTTLCMSTAVAGYKRSFGSDGPPGAYEDLAVADCVMLIGANIADNHPILTCWLQANENPKKTLIVVDPRATKTAMMADIFLPLAPRSDIALLNGMMHIILAEGLADRAYIESHTNGFAELESSLKKYTPEFVSAATGLSEELIRKAALAYGRAKSAFIGWTMGVNHSDQGTETVNVINNLALITGKIGKPGSAPFSITGQCNAMGTRETSCTSSLPGYRKFESEQDRAEMAALWNVDPNLIPRSRGMAYPDIIEGIVRGKIKGLWIIATNPLVSFPNAGYLDDALSRLEYLVVQDAFHPTPTTERADLVLPAAMWGEKEGTYTNSERRVSKVNKAVEPPGEALSDFEIFLKIGEKLGLTDELYPGWRSPRDAFEEWRHVSKGRLCDYSGISYDLLEAAGAIQWPFGENSLSGDELITEAKKSRRLYEDGVFQTADGKAQLFAVDAKASPEPVSEEYPFVLNTGRTVEHWHTRTKTGKIDILEKLSPQAWIEMNSRDARKLHLKQGDLVRVTSRRGEIGSIALRITEIVAPGQVFIPFHWFETNSNNLTLNVCDPISREPNYKQCAVRVDGLEP